MTWNYIKLTFLLFSIQPSPQKKTVRCLYPLLTLCPHVRKMRLNCQMLNSGNGVIFYQILKHVLNQTNSSITVFLIHGRMAVQNYVLRKQFLKVGNYMFLIFLKQSNRYIYINKTIVYLLEPQHATVKSALKCLIVRQRYMRQNAG